MTVFHQLLYHVSFVRVRKFIPRVPNCRAPEECDTTPRIYLSTSISRAITAMPRGGAALRGMLKLKDELNISPILHVYTCLTWENKGVRFVPPSDVQSIYGVPDAKTISEWWALETPKLEHRIIRVTSAELEDDIDRDGNAGVFVNDIEYKQITRLPKKAPENMFRGLIHSGEIRNALAHSDSR